MRPTVMLACVLASCRAPAIDDFYSDWTSSGVASTSSSTSSGSTMDDSGVQTVTGGEDTGETSSGSGTSGMPLPTIAEVKLAPNPIEHNGTIAVSVDAEHAAGVRMLVDGDERDLEEISPGTFRGEISALTGLDNGPHTAKLTPWRAEVDGEAVEAVYALQLPEPGSTGLWEAADTLGAPGQVVALGVLPNGDLVELGNYNPGGTARCYLRRRDTGGAWSASDVVELLPGVPCVAVDLVVDPHGGLVVLAYAQGGDGVRWWLARLPALHLEPEVLSIGDKQESAEAIALHPSGDIAVCGFAPSPMLDDDVMVRLVRPGLPGQSWSLDYAPKAPHMFWERARDCVFAGDQLALVGEIHGQHDADEKYRDRLFLAELDLAADVAWRVDSPAIHTQSAGQAVAVDDLGRLIVGGYTCDDDCQPEGELRTYDGATLASLVSLGLFPVPALAVRDLAWSPAGYVLVATGGPQGSEAGFHVRAFSPAQVEPVWSFLRNDGMFNLAAALAVGPFGEVYAGGMGASGYPAIAYIGG